MGIVLVFHFTPVVLGVEVRVWGLDGVWGLANIGKGANIDNLKVTFYKCFHTEASVHELNLLEACLWIGNRLLNIVSMFYIHVSIFILLDTHWSVSSNSNFLFLNSETSRICLLSRG